MDTGVRFQVIEELLSAAPIIGCGPTTTLGIGRIVICEPKHLAQPAQGQPIEGLVCLFQGDGLGLSQPMDQQASGRHDIVTFQ